MDYRCEMAGVHSVEVGSCYMDYRCEMAGVHSVEVGSCYMDYRCEMAGVHYDSVEVGLAIWTTVVKWLGFTQC